MCIRDRNNPFPSNNINQVARRVHQIGNVYDTDLEDILQKQEELWAGVNEILALSLIHICFLDNDIMIASKEANSLLMPMWRKCI